MKLKTNVLLLEARRGVEPIVLDSRFNFQLFDELIPVFTNLAADNCAWPVQLEDDHLQDVSWQRQPVRDDRGLLIITSGCDLIFLEKIYTRHGSIFHWEQPG